MVFSKNFVLILLVGLLLVGSVSAVEYYVDYESGSDFNNGLSTSAPFKHAPGDPESEGVSAAATLQPGDVVKFKGGTVYPRPIYTNWNGASNNNIVYEGDSWGAGKTVLDMNYQYYQVFESGFADFIIVKGFDITRARDPALGGVSGMIRFSKGNHDWTIINNIFRELQNWDNSCGYNGGTGFVDSPAVFATTGDGGAYNIIIDGNEFFAMGKTVVRIRNGHDFTISNNDFGGIDRGDLTGWYSVALRIEVEPYNIFIKDNKFHDAWQYGGDDDPVELCHANDYIHTYAASGSTIGPHNMIIERNTFSIDKHFNYKHGTAFMSISTLTSDSIIRNNLFVNNPGEQNVVLGEVNNIDVYNNLFITRKHVNNVYSFPFEIKDVATNVNVVNNVFWSDHDRLVNIRIPADHSGTIDNNMYYHALGSEKPFLIVGLGTKTFAEWQALGYDVNGYYGDPEFVYMPENPAFSSAGDYRLAASSFGIDNGKDLSGTGFTDDLVTVSRPQGSGWDIGPYEFVQGNSCVPADGDCDGCIDLNEISSYVGLWLNGGVDLQDVSDAVGLWLSGTGCS